MNTLRNSSPRPTASIQQNPLESSKEPLTSSTERDDRGISTKDSTTATFPIPPVLTLQEPSPEARKPNEVESKRRATAREFQASPLNSPRAPGTLLGNPSKPKTPGYSNIDSSRPRSPLSKSTSVYDNDGPEDYFGSVVHAPVPSAIMSRRKLWVKRPNASATLVKINEDDLVDEVRDLIITKYANSLGRSFDAPDVTLRIVPRERSQQVTERTLGPDESMVRTLEAYYPGGQLMDEALLIDIPQPQRRITPRPSPRIKQAPLYEDHRPVEHDTDYFPPMPVASPSLTQSSGPHAAHEHRPSLPGTAHPHSMAVLETGQLPPLPSPSIRERKGRPRFARQHTTSPTIVNSNHSNHASGTSINHTPRNRPRVSSIGHASAIPAPPPLPTPPAQSTVTDTVIVKASTPPIDHAGSPRNTKVRRPRRQATADPAQDRAPNVFLAAGLLDGSVPPINILIVEDNIINLKLLEAFVKRLKVRWATAMNGRDAVTKWRAGGFHLVLMDIQMPIMNGLEATKEMRRLERVNGIGIFAKGDDEDRVTAIKPNGHANGDATDVDRVGEGVNNDDKLTGSFKSPVIIVALTASSLQSDRHEALAAGCNDFLTKVSFILIAKAYNDDTNWEQPVNYVWLERKIMEWGCMQALIDFDGWRQWKAYAASIDGAGDGRDKGKAKAKKKEELDPAAAKAKQELKDAKRAALLAKMG